MRVRMAFYNERTGEIYEEIDRVLIIGKQPYIRDKNFIKVFVAFLSDVLEDRELGAGAWRLLIYAIQNMDYNSLRVYMVPEETAEKLGVTKRTFYNWLRVLTKNGYLEKIATNIYRIKPYTAIKGNMEATLKTEPDF
jgi:DNA-binding transcriptional ArsR family regulator